MYKSIAFRPTIVALSVAMMCAGTQASMVRDDVNYQYFRDFAENKGQFSVGAKNILIFDKQGKQVGTMLPNLPMPDLHVASRVNGVATLFNPQYIVSVKHNVGYGSVQFGEDGKNPDSHHFDYLIVDRNNHDKYDFHSPRLHKLVTEVTPIPLNNIAFDNDKKTGPKNGAFLDKERYPYFVRVGSGRQYLRSKDGKEKTSLTSAYNYLTGGTPLKPNSSMDNWVLFSGDLYETLGTYGLPGDSGSALLAYDAKEQRWVLAGVLSTFNGYDGKNNIYTIIQPDSIHRAFENDEMTVSLNGSTYSWQNRGVGKSVLQSGNQAVEIPVTNVNVASKDENRQRPSLDNGKTVHFTGRDGSTLVLKESINQGAGALHFNQNVIVRTDSNDVTWLGAGVVVNGNKTVNWRVKNPKNDRLSKLGTGTLYVDGQGKNLGDISVGEGTVVLDQKALNGKQQAFNQVGITSGRGTVVLANDKQVNPDNIYFGFRGGRLDVNGNALTFHQIQNTDDGAQIVNHSRTKTADLTFIGKENVNEQDVEWVNWGVRPKTDLAIYEYKNNYRKNRLDYFRLKDGANPRAYFPWDMETTKDWEFLGNDKNVVVKNVLAEANAKKRIDTFSGFLGENDRSLHNGAMNVTYRPTRENSTWVLNGGANLNGNLNVTAGNVVLSGIPVPHAYDHLNKKDVVDENDWINRQFIAREFNVSGSAILESSRNVSLLEGNFNAQNQAKIQLGFAQGQSSECIRSAYSGTTKCTENIVLSERTFNALPVTSIHGNVDLKENSQLMLGKAHLHGRINSTPMTQIHLQPSSEWTLTGNSVVGNLDLSPNSQITLNSQYDEVNVAHQGNVSFNQLTVNGKLTGNGHFRFLTNVAERRGDNVVVNGLASGHYLLSMNNTGKDPNEVNPLSLLKLNHPEQNRQNIQVALENGFVDLGAYRYILANRNNDYRLYNPLRDSELYYGSSAALVAQSQRDFDDVHQALVNKEAELARLQKEYSEAQGQKNVDQARVDRLLAEIRQTNNSIDKVFFEYNSTPRIRFIKRRNLYNEFTKLQSTLQSQRDTYRGLNGQAKVSQQQAAQLLKTVNQITNDVKTLSSQQDSVLAEVNRLQAGYASSIARAQQLCEAQGLSTALCRQVATMANEDDLAIFESELDANIERVENAQQALNTAQASGDQTTINVAQSALNDATLALLSSLEQAYQTEQEIQQFLSTQTQNVAMPVQAQLISRYANTAVSELSANVNGALQIGRNLDRHLLSQDPSNVWVNTESTKQSYRSDYFRPYKQTMTLTQIGVAQDITDNVKIGAVLSHSRANNEFDENVSGKNRLTSVNAFIKGSWENGVWASFDLGYGRSRNSVNFDGVDNVFHRNIFNVGGNLGAKWDWGINVQPSVGVRFYRFSGAAYQLAEANIKSDTLRLTTYRAGLQLDKTFEFNDVKLTPSFATNYYDATQRKLASSGVLSVNDVAMQQQFGRYFTHELGLSAQFKQWNLSTNVGMLKGSDVAPQKYVAAKVGFTW
nr:S6 family peptidase [uncultured Haemophilus sp.]